MCLGWVAVRAGSGLRREVGAILAREAELEALGFAPEDGVDDGPHACLS